MINNFISDKIHELSISCSENIALRKNLNSLTYNDLNILINKIAKEYKENFKIISRSTVGILMKDPINFTVSYIALLRIDAIPIPIYHNIGSRKLKKLLFDYNINFLLSDSIITTISQNLRRSVNNLESLSKIHCYPLEVLLDNSIPSQVMTMIATSGTTSSPKLVMLTKNNVLENIEAIKKYLNVSRKEKVLIIKEKTHSSTIIGEILLSLYSGYSISFLEGLAIKKNLLYTIEKFQITILFSIPSLIGEFTEKDIVKIPSLKRINIYGESIQSDKFIRLIKVLKKTNCDVIYSYGQTEAGPRVSYIYGEDFLKYPGSVGRAVDKTIVKICKNKIYTSRESVKGEIVVNGPGIMYGYYKNLEKSKEVILNNFLHTGDIGYIGENNFLFVLGRKDNMFTYFGRNIFPEEIENIIKKNSSILECRVGLDKKSKNIVAIYVAKEEICEENIIEQLYQEIDDYKIPKLFYRVKEIPKTPNGKISRSIGIENYVRRC